MIDPAPIVALLAALALLPALCDHYLVGSLVRLGEDRGWSEGTVGSGLLAVASSVPELMIALVSVFVGGGGHAGIGAATIVGSALFNLLVIVGVCAWIQRLRPRGSTLLRDCAAYAVAIAWLAWALRDGSPGSIELLCGLALYAVYALLVAGWRGGRPTEGDDDEPGATRHARWRLDRLLLRVLFLPAPGPVARIVWSVLLLAGLSWVLVDSAIDLAAGLGIPEGVLALTVLAVGTSVPDLLSSIAAARRRQGTIAVTNALGSNIFDILPGLALPWLAGLAIAGPGSITIAGREITEGIIVLGASVVVLPALFHLGGRQGLGRPGGAILLLGYTAYLAWELLLAT